jgi:hypothetical protein
MHTSVKKHNSNKDPSDEEVEAKKHLASHVITAAVRAHASGKSAQSGKVKASPKSSPHTSGQGSGGSHVALSPEALASHANQAGQSYTTSWLNAMSMKLMSVKSGASTRYKQVNPEK